MSERAVPVMRTTDSGHVRLLDGIRGIAVLTVMLFHFSVSEHLPAGGPHALADRAYWAVAGMGWVGVDIFFVLSGYLITSILLRTKERAGYFRSFYARRVLRIFPLYYAFLLLWMIVLPTALHLAGRHVAEIEEGQENQLWYWLYIQNFYVFIYGAKPAHGLGHFWSLAIEEQFYIVWPFLVWVLPRRGVAWATGAMIVGSMVVRWVMARNGYTEYQILTFTPARVDSLGLGALLAVLVQGRAAPDWLTVWGRRLFWPLTAAAVGVLLVLGEHSGEQMWWTYTLITAAAGCLIVYGSSSAEGSATYRFLNARWLRRTGEISYGLYVFHVPIRALLIRVFPERLVMGFQLPWLLVFAVMCLVASYVVAELSWRLFESRVLKLKKYFAYTEGRRPLPPAP